MSLTTNCKSEKGCKVPLNLCTSVNQTAVIEGLQETKVKIIIFDPRKVPATSSPRFLCNEKVLLTL